MVVERGEALSSRMTRVYHGIDIGGTKIGVCIGDGDGRVIASTRFETDHTAAASDVLDRAFAELAGLMRAARARGEEVGEAAAVGAACPGPLSYGEARFLEPPNMAGWHGFRIGEELRRRSGCVSGFMNDANAAAWAEHLWGAARGTRSSVFLTMSTGMGAGLVLDGRLYEGPLGLAGEIGHVRLADDGPVGFGKRGSVEGFLSGPGMVQIAKSEALACAQRGETTRLSERELTTRVLFEAARSGDTAALRCVDRIGAALGKLVAMLTDVLNPEVIAMGTIGRAHADLLVERAMRVVREEAIGASAGIVRLVASGLSEPGMQQALAVAKHVDERTRGA